MDIRTLKKRGTAVIPVTQKIEDNAMGELVQLMFLGIAAYEAAIIKQRTSGGRAVKIRRDGTWGGGITPYGYSSPGEGLLVIHEAEAQLVRLIFELYRAGYKFRAIAESLNNWGIKPKRGAQWHSGTIRNIIIFEAQYRAEGRFEHVHMDEATPIIQPPILEHRENVEERIYVWKNPEYPRLPREHRVPNDLFGEPLRLEAPVWERRFTKSQADVLLTAFHLYDCGTKIREVARELRRLNMKSIRGRIITENAVSLWLKDRVRLETIALQSGGEVISEPLNGAEGPLEQLARTRVRALELRELIVRQTTTKKDIRMSFERIASTLNTEGYHTIRGASWKASQVEDLIKGKGMYRRIVAISEFDQAA